MGSPWKRTLFFLATFYLLAGGWMLNLGGEM